MRAEKFIEKKEYNNILIRVFETKEIADIDIDINLLLETIEQVAGEDYEAQYEAGLSHDYTDEWYSIDIDKVIEKFTEYVEDEYNEDTHTYDNCFRYLKIFEDMKGYVIYND